MTGMVPRIIHDHLNPSLMKFINHSKEHVICCGKFPGGRIVRYFRLHDLHVSAWVWSKIAIDVPPVAGVIFVERGRIIYRVEVDSGNTQRINVIQLIKYSLQIPTVPPQLRFLPE